MRNVRRIGLSLTLLVLPVIFLYAARAQLPMVTNLTELDDLIQAEWSTNVLPFPPSIHYGTDLGVISYDAGFDTNFLAQLPPDTNGVVIVFPLLAEEDSNSVPRVRYLYNGTSAVVRTLTPPPEYDPTNWVEDIYGNPPSWLSGEELGHWYSDRDPARQHLSLSLISTGDVPAFLEDLTNQTSSVGGGTGLDTNEIGFVYVTAPAGSPVLYLHAPQAITHIDIFGKDQLSDGEAWQAAASLYHHINPIGWTPPATAGTRFWAAADALADADDDGIANGMEALVFGTKWDDADSDDDQLDDGVEAMNFGSNALNSDSDGEYQGKDPAQGCNCEYAHKEDGDWTNGTEIAAYKIQFNKCLHELTLDNYETNTMSPWEFSGESADVVSNNTYAKIVEFDPRPVYSGTEGYTSNVWTATLSEEYTAAKLEELTSAQLTNGACTAWANIPWDYLAWPNLEGANCSLHPLITPASYRDLATDETELVLMRLKYRFVVPTDADKVYQIAWVEMFVPDETTNPGASSEVLNAFYVRFKGTGGVVYINEDPTVPVIGTGKGHTFIVDPPSESLGNGRIEVVTPTITMAPAYLSVLSTSRDPVEYIATVSDSVPSGVNWKLRPSRVSGLAPPARITSATPTNALVFTGEAITNYTLRAELAALPQIETLASFDVVCDCDSNAYPNVSAVSFVDSIPYPSAGCAPGTTGALLWSTNDLCGNTLEMWCNTQYQLKYNGIVIGQCIYKGGGNENQFYISRNRCRFLKTEWTTADDSQSGIAYAGWDEGTLFKYDWSTYQFNCLTEILTTNCFEGDVRVHPSNDPSITSSLCE